MKKFENKQRIVVDKGPLEGLEGTVVRLRRSDECAWVSMDERFYEDSSIYPFPADDSRATHTLLHPWECKELAF
jgi:hypothetical protein